jgi:uncharacterized delta-60 repeat protein
MRRIKLFATLFLGLAGSVEAAPGDLDPSFGNGGVVITDIGGFQNIAGRFELQPDGKILVTFAIYDDAKGTFSVIRYLPDGVLDTGFSSDGFAVTRITDDRSDDERSDAVIIQPDGKIVVVGHVAGPVGVPTVSSDIVLVRY